MLPPATAPGSTAPPLLPAAAAPALPTSRLPLRLGAAGTAGTASPASAPSTARRSMVPASALRPPRRRGFDRQDLRAFLEARGAGERCGPAVWMLSMLSNAVVDRT